MKNRLIVISTTLFFVEGTPCGAPRTGVGIWTFQSSPIFNSFDC